VLSAIEALKLTEQNLKHPLIVLATADEESSMSGARALVKSHLLDARYAIIGEPTNLTPIRMHKGITMERLNIRGKAGHSSNPNLGNNAIEAMQLAIAELLDLRKELQNKHQNPAFSISQPTMNLGCIHGGDNANRICGECYLDFDIRPLPGMSLQSLQHELEHRLHKVGKETGTQLSVERLFPGVEAFEQAENSDLVALCERLTGQRSESVAFATEAPFLHALGMQTIVLGPGSIDQAHQPNEYLHLDQISPAINIVKSAIGACCL
jgi:acetylornithine deacetylase